MNYKIAMTSVSFDNSYENVLKFNNLNEQKAYFNLSGLFQNQPVVNWNVSNIFRTQFFYQAQNIENINQLLSQNYVIVYDILNDFYYYYFVTDSNLDSGNQILLTVELDIFNTYYLFTDFSECLIERAHISRFIKIGVNNYSFNGTPASALFTREPLQGAPKRLVERIKCDIKYSNDPTIQQWFENNILCWQYLYISAGNLNSYSLYNTTQVVNEINNITYSVNSENELNGASSVLCMPVYKNRTGLNNNVLIIKYTSTIPGENVQVFINDYNFKGFMTNNDGASRVYTYKLSMLPPPGLIENIFEAVIDENNNLIYDGVITDAITPSGAIDVPNRVARIWATKTKSTAQTNNVGCYQILTQNNASVELETIILPIQFDFQNNEIVGALKSPIFNPKLLSEDYFEMQLNLGNGETYTYDLQKLNSNVVNLEYTEALTPDITRGYLRVITNGNNVYVPETANNWTGLVNSCDNSLLLSNTQLAEFYANNKNFWLQTNSNITFDTTKGVISSIGQLSGKTTSAIITGIDTALNAHETAINARYSIDNMRQAPNLLKNANGNTIFNQLVTDIAPYIELYEILPNEKNIINDYMFKFGYSINKIGRPKDYDNIRYYFNFVQAKLENITSTKLLSNVVRNKFKDVYNNGVRFWNVYNNDAIFSYDYENYERFWRSKNG